MINRLCIYLIYDTDKIVDDYIGTALKELKKFSDRLVVVCNFDHIEIGESNVTDYADEVFYRENIGYDAGGYQEALSRFVTWEMVYEYDELLLTNDTWFGPIYPLDDMMDRMQSEDCDYWGITRHLGGKYWFGDGADFPTHVQSYFLDFKYKLLHSRDFRLFWNDYVCSNDRNETIKNFEIGMNNYLIGKCYIGKAYMDLFEFPFLRSGVNFYLKYSYELIRDIKMPVLKKTAIDFDNKGFPNALKALEYVKYKTDYDYSLIEKYLKRIWRMGRGKTNYDFDLVEEFIRLHTRIFIYGHGVWGRRLADVFEYKGWHFDGYLVTEIDENEVGEDVQPFSDIDIREDDGVIIAQRNRDVCDSIVDYIVGKVSVNNILTPNYGRSE